MRIPDEVLDSLLNAQGATDPSILRKLSFRNFVDKKGPQFQVWLMEMCDFWCPRKQLRTTVPKKIVSQKYSPIQCRSSYSQHGSTKQKSQKSNVSIKMHKCFCFNRIPNSQIFSTIHGVCQLEMFQPFRFCPACPPSQPLAKSRCMPVLYRGMCDMKIYKENIWKIHLKNLK